MKHHVTEIPEPRLSRYLFADTRLSILWLVIRLYVGYEWLQAGVQKVMNPAWTGDKAGVAITGFVRGALEKTTGPHPDVSNWYASFLKDVVLEHAAVFSYTIAFGEVLVGIALILGLFTGISAFFGAFMNMNFLFAGAVSINPLLFLLQLFLILAWRVAGFIGVDRFILPLIGTPWYKGKVFSKKK